MFFNIVNYNGLIIDCSLRDLLGSAASSVVSLGNRSDVIQWLEKRWTSDVDQRPVLPLLSVRSALDQYLTIKNYPPGSEIIMSAINIPDMAYVVRHHGLKIVSLDVSIETLAPKEERLESLISENTVAVLLAHIYGKWFDIGPFVAAAKKHKLDLIEDCAEAFCGFERMGHPDADITLFSFGIIKHCTAFGGAIAKVRDPVIHQRMSALNDTYPVQSHSTFLYKVLKYSIIYFMLDYPCITGFFQHLFRTLGVNYKRLVMSYLRGFPQNLIKNLHQQPSLALLQSLKRRFERFSEDDMDQVVAKGDYAVERLPEGAVAVGHKAHVNNYWLFPVIVDNPAEVIQMLNDRGVDAYADATQLTLIEPDQSQSSEEQLPQLESFLAQYPEEAKYLMRHVIYLPVSRIVPFKDLDRICEALDEVLKTQHLNKSSDSSVGSSQGHIKVKLQSKL